MPNLPRNPINFVRDMRGLTSERWLDNETYPLTLVNYRIFEDKLKRSARQIEVVTGLSLDEFITSLLPDLPATDFNPGNVRGLPRQRWTNRQIRILQQALQILGI